MTMSFDETAGIQPESPFYNLPLPIYEGIFDHLLNDPSIRTCRLICTEWYSTILKLYSRPNGFCIRTNKYSLNPKKYLEETLKKSLETRDYEDPDAPVENMKFEDVDIQNCLHVFQKSADLRETAENITHLNLTNVFFRDCETLLEFLSKFKKLRKLGLVQCTFSALEEISIFHLRWYHRKKLGAISLPESLTYLYIETNQDCNSFILLADVLSVKIKNLEIFQLKVIPINEGKFTNAVMFVTGHLILSSQYRTTFFICWLIQSMLKNSEESLRSLRIDWKMDGTSCMTDPVGEVQLFTAKRFDYFAQSFSPYLIPTNNLRLRELQLKLGNAVIHIPQVAHLLIPFVAMQVQWDLRQVVLSKVVSSIIFPNEVYQQIFFNYTALQEPSFFKKFISQMKMSLSLEMLLRASKNEAHVMKGWLQLKYSLLFLKELILIISPHPGGDTQVTEFVEWLPEYKTNNPAPSVASDNGIFSGLRVLKIICEMVDLSNFSIFRISLQFPNLEELEIIDGDYNNFTNKNKKIDQLRVSQVEIRDCDLRFIISKLQNLKVMNIWAHMVLLTDFGVTGCSSEDALPTSFVNGDSIKTHFNESVPTALQNEANMEVDSEEYTEALGNILVSPISGLKRLQQFSLRGVGNAITDKIIDSFVSDNGSSYFVGLETFEIIGFHTITKAGTQKLKKAIKTVKL